MPVVPLAAEMEALNVEDGLAALKESLKKCTCQLAIRGCVPPLYRLARLLFH